MQPPLTGCRLSNFTSPRGEAGVREVQALDQYADEGAVELAAAGDARLLERADEYAKNPRVARGGDGRAAYRPGERKIGHLAEAFAGAEDGEELFVLGDAHFALEHDAEE